MQYMLLIYGSGDSWQELTPEQQQAIGAEYFAFTEELRSSGKMVAGDALQPISTATSVRIRDGETLTTDGPERRNRPKPPRADAGAQGGAARTGRGAPGRRGGCHPRRAARADLRLLPPGARNRGAGRADAEPRRRPRHARDRARLPRPGADARAAARPGEAEDPRRRHPPAPAAGA